MWDSRSSPLDHRSSPRDGHVARSVPVKGGPRVSVEIVGRMEPLFLELRGWKPGVVGSHSATMR